MTLPVGSSRWIALLAALVAITALAIDMSLPAQPALARAFRVTSDGAQLTLSVFLFGYAVGQLIVGYLADACGRRPVLLAGLALFCLAGLACAMVSDLPELIAFRFLQGSGAAAGTVVAQAMVRDTHSEAGAARVFATMTAALALAPMVAPLLGGFVLAHLGWRAIFATQCLCGAALAVLVARTLAETLEARRPVSPKGIARDISRFVRTAGTRLPTALVALSFACQFAFIAGSPFVLIEGYGIDPSRYGLYFGSTAIALMLGSASGGRLLKKGHSPWRVVEVGAVALGVAGVLLIAPVRAPGVFGLMIPMVLCFVGLGLVSPSATAIAMDPVPEIAGTAAAVLGFLEMSAGALSGYAIAKLGGSNPRALAFQVAGLALACTGLVAIGRLTKDANPD